jgi:hypothetical protein
MFIRTANAIVAVCVLLSGAVLAGAQDLPNSKDPAGMKRYEGSELIGYRAPIFDEYLLPLDPPSSFSRQARQIRRARRVAMFTSSAKTHFFNTDFTHCPKL